MRDRHCGSCGKKGQSMTWHTSKDETGKLYGQLRVLRKVGKSRHGDLTWLCHCACGKDVVVPGDRLRNGNTKGCGCLQGTHNRLPAGVASCNHLYSSYRNNAKKRGFIWELNREQFGSLTSQPCWYCGKLPAQVHGSTTLKDKSGRVYGNGGYVYNGIDRIDSSRGYQVGNVRPCCKCCNFAKQRMSEEEFLGWVGQVFRHRADQYLLEETVRVG